MKRISLPFKWIRIIYRCWQTRQPYREVEYLESFRKSNFCNTARQGG